MFQLVEAVKAVAYELGLESCEQRGGPLHELRDYPDIGPTGFYGTDFSSACLKTKRSWKSSFTTDLISV